MATRADEMIAPFVRLRDALGLSLDADEITLRALAHVCGWGARATTSPLLPSGIRHGAPWGLSMVLGAGAPELRMLVEAQAEPASAASYWRAVGHVNAWIAGQRGATIDRLASIAERFVPSERARFRGWHAVAFRPHHEPRYRIYLCAENDESRIEAALTTLERYDGLAAVPRRAGDELTILSLDLHAAGRTKLYRLRPSAMAEDVVDESLKADARTFATILLGAPEIPIGWLTCFSLRADQSPQCALHLSLERHVAAADTALRLTTLLRAFAIDPAPYHAALSALQPRHHFVSLQRSEGAPRVTIYFLPDVAR